VGFCGDDVGSFVLWSLVLSELSALVPTVVAWRRGDPSLGCGLSLMLGVAALLLVAMEPFYAESFGSLLDCFTATRPIIIVGLPPVLTLCAAGMSILLTLRGS
jgi:hypothetical protein